MEHYPSTHFDDHLIRIGNLIVDLGSFEEGFTSEARYRREIWDYLECAMHLGCHDISNRMFEK